ncbi:MAG TPA: DUF4159 domain-containing protein [Gemmatimonadaceae bacterium]|nr:DUF4159 domain-containing protein [Gemmatimonadaceae bacterium]
MLRYGVIATVGFLAMALSASTGGVQDRYCYTQWDDESAIQNGRYDGRFTFFRVRFEPLGGQGWGRRRDKKWDHDTPRAERHFMKILEEITTLRPQMYCGAIYPFGDPESFKYPIAYVSEPGFWTLNEQELRGVREYVAKGGFIIFDDFFGSHWYNFEDAWRRAFPDLQIVKLDASHPIFDSFYHIASLDMLYEGPGGFSGARAEFYGAFEDNDPSKRLVMIANYNNDLGDYMEWSDEGWLPISLSNEAYKLMVNYVVYAMTH